jgi:hypothetical protein
LFGHVCQMYTSSFSPRNERWMCFREEMARE